MHMHMCMCMCMCMHTVCTHTGGQPRVGATCIYTRIYMQVGDLVWGYCVAASALQSELGPDESARLPDVLLVKKSYSERRRRPLPPYPSI